MFTLTRPTITMIRKRLAAAEALPFLRARWLAPECGLKAHLPVFFAHDASATVLGQGDALFAVARQALERWAMFDLGWVRVANPAIQIERGAAVAVEAYTFGLWTLNISRIVEVVDRAGCFGFVYATTAGHVEFGEERFLIAQDEDGTVRYRLEAVSRPRAGLAWMGYPVTRYFQRRFARESHARMKVELSDVLDRF